MSQTDDTSEIVVVIIKNKQDDFFVHQRAKNKKTFPNLYGLGIGGHIKIDERRKEAAKRELKEEAGFETQIKYLFSIKYQSDDGSPYKVYIYETLARQKISKHTEWQWSGWMSQKELDRLQRNKKLCPDTALFYQEYKISNHL